MRRDVCGHRQGISVNVGSTIKQIERHNGIRNAVLQEFLIDWRVHHRCIIATGKGDHHVTINRTTTHVANLISEGNIFRLAIIQETVIAGRHRKLLTDNRLTKTKTTQISSEIFDGSNKQTCLLGQIDVLGTIQQINDIHWIIFRINKI